MASMKGDMGIISPDSDSIDTDQRSACSKDPVICLPARLGEEVMGFLCLDGRL